MPDEKLVIIEELIELLHNACLLIDDIEDNSSLRSGIPVAHQIYGVPLTINAANYIYFIAMQKVLTLEHVDVTKIFVGQQNFFFDSFFDSIDHILERMLDFHRGQGMEIWWRENFVSPSEEEYCQMVSRKTGSLLSLAVDLMRLFSSNSLLEFDRLCQLLSLFFQIRDDYCNLICENQSSNKGFCEDLTEGKFSFPILHAVNSRDADTRIIHILKQRTQNKNLKHYCIQLLQEFGSIDYTQRTCQKLAKQILDQIKQLGGNAYLQSLIQDLIKAFPEDNDGYVTDQVEDDSEGSRE